MRNNYNSAKLEHVEAAALATCAQVEYWLEITESIAIIGGVKSFNMSGISINFNDKGLDKICNRAAGYLNHQGLMYRGI